MPHRRRIVEGRERSGDVGTDRSALRQPAAFLDRDGVINVDHGYTWRPTDLALTPTAAAGIRRLNAAGYLVVVVTNQSGVARGLYTEEDVHVFHRHLSTVLAPLGARIDAFYHSPFHPEGSVAAFATDHPDRKPGCGMILAALRDLPIKREGSFLIGDQPSDAEAAAAAGIPCRLIRRNSGDLSTAAAEMLDLYAPDRILLRP